MDWTTQRSRKLTMRPSQSLEDGTNTPLAHVPPPVLSRPASPAQHFSCLVRGLNGFDILVLSSIPRHGQLADPVLVQSRFLLKYASRDEVELLGRGNGGVVEVRNAVAEYEEKSPLYGFLRYRRRNVIIKYLPDDCSRLVQGLFQRALCYRILPAATGCVPYCRCPIKG
jgi:hypothetical protein